MYTPDGVTSLMLGIDSRLRYFINITLASEFSVCFFIFLMLIDINLVFVCQLFLCSIKEKNMYRKPCLKQE